MVKSTLEILLIEDNEGDVELTRRAFRENKETVHISVANDGMEAINFLHKLGENSDAPTPDLVLLDLNMPRMDGKKFLDIVKTDEKLKTIPVVMLTSSESPTDVRDCYERHANFYVVKPFDSREFSDVIRKTVHFWGDVVKLPE